MNTEFRPQKGSSAALAVGIGIIVLGVALTLDNMFPNAEVWYWFHRLWPLLLVAFGAFRFWHARVHGGSTTGPLVLLGVGLLLSLHKLSRGNLGDLIGPLVVIATGVAIVVFSLKKRRAVPPELHRNPGFLHGTAILSGVKQRPLGTGFQGGEMTAIFGGFEVDLRQVEMEGDSARLDFFVLFGGGDIRIPEHWEVVNHATAIAGGVEDRTSHGMLQEQGKPRLILTGTTLFGGIEIKH